MAGFLRLRKAVLHRKHDRITYVPNHGMIPRTGFPDLGRYPCGACGGTADSYDRRSAPPGAMPTAAAQNMLPAPDAALGTVNFDRPPGPFAPRPETFPSLSGGAGVMATAGSPIEPDGRRSKDRNANSAQSDEILPTPEGSSVIPKRAGDR